MKIFRNIILLLAVMSIISCSNEKKYKVGVSQGYVKLWSDLVDEEILKGAAYYDDMDVDMRTKAANCKEQIASIDSFIKEGKDLIIVSANDADSLRPVIEKAYDKGIHVVLVDRKIDGDRYTAFVGVDNHAVGRGVAAYLADEVYDMTGVINIVEIRGRDNSSTAKERHAGFDVITKVYNTMPTSPNKWNILASVEASWQKDRAKAVMDSLLKAHDRIDYVYCHSDFMAKGAYEAIKAAGKEKETLILSVDALPQDGAGLDMVINKQFLATYTNPVPGIEAMDVAHSILSGEKFRKTTLLGSEVVDSTNAEAIKYHYEKSHRQDAKLHSIETIVDEKSMTINRGKWVFAGNIVIILLLVLLFLSQRRVKKEINNTDDMMMMQLQMQIQEAAANKIAQETTPEATTEATAPTPEKPQEVIPEAPQPDPFFAEVEQIIIKHIGDSNFSVNDIADELGMSRIQLYRKIKTRSEKNVSDLIRTARLERAYQLLTTTHKTISEIAFKVGFSSPSYFTKCFKEHYGYGPSEL